MTRPQPTGTTHDRHDRTLIAASLSGDLPIAARAAADDLLASCPECASLAVDLRAIAAATRALPPRRPPVGRAFTLTSGDAARLRRRGWLRSLLRPFGPDGIVAARPIGLALSTLGLVGVLLSASPLAPSFLGTGGAAPYDRMSATESSGDPKARPTEAPAANPTGDTGEGALPPDAGGSVDEGPVGPGGQATDPEAGPTVAPITDDRDTDVAPLGPPPLTVVSVAILAAGFLLLGARFVARRLA